MPAMNMTPGDEAAQYQSATFGQEQAQAMPLAAPQQYPPVPPPYGQGLALQQVQPHSTGLAVVASLFVPGLGSMINDKVGKGIGILAAYIAAVALVFVVIGFVAAPAVWIWGMVAASNDARAWNRAHGIMS
jgi:TM2 domain-containing membrane protein YozV